MKAIPTYGNLLPKDLSTKVLIVYVCNDAALVLNGTTIGTVFDEDGMEALSNLRQIGVNLAATLTLDFCEAEVDFETEEELMDWNFKEVVNELIYPSKGENS